MATEYRTDRDRRMSHLAFACVLMVSLLFASLAGLALHFLFRAETSSSAPAIPAQLDSAATKDMNVSADTRASPQGVHSGD